MHRKRVVARILGISLLAVWSGSSCGGKHPERPAAAPLAIGEQAARVLSEAIRLRTVNPPGDEAPLAAYFVETLKRAGLDAQRIDTPRGSSRVGRAAAWALLRGSGRRPPLVLLSHLDTVPAYAERWSDDPFAGVRRDGYVVGRGAQDAKGVAVIQLLTLLELARRDAPLERDVIFLATPDEESGGRDGAGWIVHQRRSLLRGATSLLTEGGGVLTSKSGRPTWQVAVTEKSPCWLRISAKGPPGHSAVPTPADAVPRLLDALDAVRKLRTPVRVVPEVARMFAALSPAAPAADRRPFRDLTRALDDAAFRKRFLAEASYAALVQDSYSVTVLQGAPRTNVLPAEATAHIDARLLPGSRCEDFAARVRRSTRTPGVTVETLLSFSSRASRLDTPLYRAVAAVAERSDPGAIMVPRVNAGFTDAHWFREIGLDVYGFVPRWHHVGERRGVHGPNERISIENLERGVRTLVEIVEELDRQDPS